MAKSRKLRNIRVAEVSLVDHPANLRPFMFIKSDSANSDPTGIEKQFKSLDLAVKSDGTAAGTTVTLNGRDIADLRGFMLSLSPIGEDMSIYAEYSVANRGKTGDGFDGYATYRLSKCFDIQCGPTLNGEESSGSLTNPIGKGSGSGLTDIENVEAYLEDLPANLRQSVQNIIGAVRTAEATTKESVMPNEDGKETVKETPVAVAPVIDVNQIASAVVAQLKEAGVSAEGIKAAVLGQIAADRKVADDAAAVETKAHADKVLAGEELEFISEDEMLAALAAEANQMALDDAEKVSA